MLEWDCTVELVESMESCCLCIATSSVVFCQASGGGAEVAVWSAGLAIRKKSRMQYRGEQRHGAIFWQLCI